MALTYANPADVINGSLGRIGYKRQVGNLYDGSAASSAALAIYGQTRDDMLRNFDWGFAEQDMSLTLLKTAPVTGYSPTSPWTTANPILPWKYEYQYDSAILKVRSLRDSSTRIPQYDPQAIEFRVANDKSYTPAKKVILTNLENAVAVYTAQITDPLLWEAGFTETLVAALGRRLAPVLMNMDAAKMEAADEQVTTQTAEMKIG